MGNKIIDAIKNVLGINSTSGVKQTSSNNKSSDHKGFDEFIETDSDTHGAAFYKQQGNFVKENMEASTSKHPGRYHD